MPPPQENLIIKNAARYAMSHPANPRTHSSKENPHRGHYFNPHVTLGKDLAHARDASEIITAIGSSHSQAHARQSGFPAAAKVPLAHPKVKGKFRSTPKPEIGSNLPKINVIISKIEHRGRQGIKPFKDSNHKPVITEYPQATPWSKVVEDIRLTLDNVHTESIPYRIRRSSQFSLRYNTTGNSRVFLHEDHTKDTISFLWASSISMPGNLLVSAKSEKSNILDLVAVVDYPPNTRQGNSFESGEDTSLTTTFLEPPPSRIVKRKSDEHLSIASRTVGPAAKRTALFIPSETQYYSKIAISLASQKTTKYLVEKFDLSFENEQPKWTLSSDRLTIHVEDTHFSSGSTKHVYKLRCDQTVYAAKRFYNIGNFQQDNGVPHDDNYKHLQEELIRQFIVNLCAEKFQNLCEKNSIAAFAP
ncbi:hypothetical protein D9619_010549 [Psilocybe cf. subviscida]|uniref:Uncharacterized protein n=1 Tax=Psilocybe cf. subviscida TaxID=2480587 RepID=A0A8H5ATG6_9AGAR|nr:hypothetical protein D9619_010549 [Psilocybe cf. subviscida]